MLYKIDFLSEEECKTVRDSIFSLKKHWINRGLILPFYSLGSASYMDSNSEDDTLYRLEAEKYNPILQSTFSKLYGLIAKVLEKETGCQVEYEKGCALPGFHIFLADKSFEQPIAPPHFDLQFESVNWSYKNIDYAHPVSITLPIMLPHSGGGLNYWDIYEDECKNITLSELEKLRNSKETKYLAYEEGKLVIQRDRLCLHQIAPSKNLEKNDERITLQGHGLLCDDILRLYW
jgi:hypothetical protein